jgi:hypothetical protein
MTEQEHTLKLVVGVLNAVCHMLEPAMSSGGNMRLQLAASDAYESATRTKRTLSRSLATEMLARTAPAAETARTLESDIAEDRH